MASFGMIVHERQGNPTDYRVPMVRCHTSKQLSLAEFDWPFRTALDENNCWVKLSRAFRGISW